jgi:hypothetical protein
MANTLKRFLALATVSMLLWGQTALVLADDVDETDPSHVENLEVFPGDEEATLTWDPATDDTGVAGYNVYSGLSSVSEDGGTYTFGSQDVGDVTTYIYDSLQNGVTYYFAVTAYDEAGNTSGNYSLEVEVTPEASEVGDFTEPTVTDASALTSTLLTVEFSEDIVLPSGAASAFSIESAEGEMLEIYDAYLSDDPTVVFVVTAEQTAGAQYILTAGIDIEDEAGNPIVSGTSDTAVFTGSAVDEMVDEDMDENEVEDEVTVPVGDGFMLELVDSVELNELVLTFSEEVGNADPDSFTIQLLDNALIDVPVLAVSIDDEDASVVTLVTEDMEAGYEYMLSIDDLVLNKDGAALSGDSEGYEFVALTLDLADLVAPEDVTDLLASAVDETTALVSWTASIDSAGDLAEYLVYRSVDGTTFGPSMSVDKALAEYEEDNLTPGATYTYKVTAKDVNNNESDGELVTITLPETGPAMAALFGLSLLGAGAVTRRRKEF